MSRSTQEQQALLDAATLQLRHELNVGVVTAQSAAREEEKDLRKVWEAKVRPSVIDYLKEHRLEDHEGAIDVVSRLLFLKQPTQANVAAAVAQAGVKAKVFSETELRQELEAELKAEGASSTLIAKFEFMSVAQLQAKLEELRNVKRWKSMSHTELQAAANAEHASTPSGVTPVPEGTPILSPSISRRALTQYAVDEMRKLIRAFDQKHGIGSGQVAVDARLSGADANEIKRLYSI
jgi:hypothetical protein